jgi:hypothetical protein
LNWAEQNHISRRLHLASLRSQIPLNISRITSHGPIDVLVQERVDLQVDDGGVRFMFKVQTVEVADRLQYVVDGEMAPQVQAINEAVADVGGGADEPAEDEREGGRESEERVFKVSPALEAVHPDESSPLLVEVDRSVDRGVLYRTNDSIGQTVEVASPDTVQLQCIAQLLVNFREEVESRVGNQNVARFLQAALSRGALKVLLGTVACITVVTLGPMHEGQPKDQPVQRRALYLESQVAGHQASTTSNRSRPSAGL